MSALSQKDTRTVLTHLEKGGAELVKHKNGYQVLFPNGSLATVHWTCSDHKSTLALRATVKRAGMTWPFDDNTNTRKKKPMAAQLSEKQEADLIRAFKKIGSGTTTVSALSVSAGVSKATASRRLMAHGFVLTDAKGLWQRAVVEPVVEPEPVAVEVEAPATVEPTELVELVEPVVAEVAEPVAEVDHPTSRFELFDREPNTRKLLPEQHEMIAEFIESKGQKPVKAAALGEAAGIANSTAIRELRKAGFKQTQRGVWRKPKPSVSTVDAYPELARAEARAKQLKAADAASAEAMSAEEAAALAALQPVNAEPSGVAPVDEPLEFLDDRDSWTIDVPEKMKAMAKKMGLCIEVRVWHKSAGPR